MLKSTLEKNLKIAEDRIKVLEAKLAAAPKDNSSDELDEARNQRALAEQREKQASDARKEAVELLSVTKAELARVSSAYDQLARNEDSFTPPKGIRTNLNDTPAYIITVGDYERLGGV